MARKIKLTPALLRKLVLQEKKKIQESLASGELEPVDKVDAKEVGPGEEADSLEKDINWMAALKIQESILKKKYAKVQKAKKRIVKNMKSRK